MAGLVAYISIVLFVMIHVHVNESRPIVIPLVFIEQARPMDMDYPTEHLVG